MLVLKIKNDIITFLDSSHRADSNDVIYILCPGSYKKCTNFTSFFCFSVFEK